MLMVCDKVFKLSGHVIYEMASEGRELTSVIPADDSSDYSHVKDREVERVLRLIFSKATEYGEYQIFMQEVSKFKPRLRLLPIAPFHSRFNVHYHHVHSACMHG
jgi:hypothetical protein